MQGAESRPWPPSPSPTWSPSSEHAAVPLVPANGDSPATGSAPASLRDDEHRLALHLSSDFEQAAVPQQSGSGLEALATEVLEEVVFHLDAPRDLHALGATCQRLRDTVHPWHTEYRFIRCRPSSVHVWHHLAGHPGLARNVRHLHILDDNTGEREVVPSRRRSYNRENRVEIRGLDTQTGQRDLILCALARMTTLAKFSWDCCESFICFDDISPTLLMCSSLREVEVTDNLLFNRIPAEETSQSNFELPNLACVTIRSARHIFPAPKQPSLDRIQRLFMFHCPNLTTLRIVYDFQWPFAPSTHKFLLCGRWPNLRTLSLHKLFCPSKGFDAAAEFLAAHPLIESLDFEMGAVQLKLTAGTLPRLRYLACNIDVAVAILTCPMTEGQTRPLEVLKGLRIGGRHDGALIEGLRLCPGLKRVKLQGYGDINDVKHLAEAVPGIAWLNVGRLTPANVAIPVMSGAMAVSSVIDWTPVLSALPELTAFHGVCFFYEAYADEKWDRSRIKQNEEVASKLRWICPKLRRVDCWDRSGEVIVLGEEGNKVNWEVQRAES